MLWVLGFFTLTFFTLIPFSYSSGHPNYHYLLENIQSAEGLDKLDVSILNEGKWKTACLFGGYTDPSYHMEKFGNVSFVDRIYQPMKSWSLWRFGQVEEHETLVAYVDTLGSIQFIHIGKTIPSGRLEYHIQCISRDKKYFIIPSDR